MFVIPCKYIPGLPFVLELVKGIRKFHIEEKIVIVDSDSEDKSYFDEILKYNVIIEDIANKNWMVGAYWYTYKKYPNEDFYFFMHDSMKVKGSLNFIKERDLTLMMYFYRFGSFNEWGELITNNSKYIYNYNGCGCYGPIFFCKNKIMKIMLEKGADLFLPKNKKEVGHCEGCYGFFLEDQGYNLIECSLFGNVLWEESINGRTGPPPHNTSWQYPIEKFYGWSKDPRRLI